MAAYITKSMIDKQKCCQSQVICYERGGIERIVEEEGGGCCRATVPAVLQYHGYCSRGGGCEGERVAARVGGAGNAGRGASPTAGKREGISF